MELRWARDRKEEEEEGRRKGGGRRREEQKRGGRRKKRGVEKLTKGVGVCHFRTAYEQYSSGGPQRTGCSQWAALIP